tara:strand:- start:79 stop:258 length:180 start_codon:yes stop_codon:yes gene_type:complete
MLTAESVCYNEVGVIIEIYPQIKRNLVFFCYKECQIACLDNELEILSENYYLDTQLGEA